MINCIFFCLKIYFTLTNSADPDEMPHHAAFHLGLHCLQKCLFMGFSNTKGYTISSYMISVSVSEVSSKKVKLYNFLLYLIN